MSVKTNERHIIVFSAEFAGIRRLCGETHAVFDNMVNAPVRHANDLSIHCTGSWVAVIAGVCRATSIVALKTIVVIITRRCRDRGDYVA